MTAEPCKVYKTAGTPEQDNEQIGTLKPGTEVLEFKQKTDEENAQEGMIKIK